MSPHDVLEGVALEQVMTIDGNWLPQIGLNIEVDGEWLDTFDDDLGAPRHQLNEVYKQEK